MVFAGAVSASEKALRWPRALQVLSMPGSQVPVGDPPFEGLMLDLGIVSAVNQKV